MCHWVSGMWTGGHFSISFDQMHQVRHVASNAIEALCRSSGYKWCFLIWCFGEEDPYYNVGIKSKRDTFTCKKK